MLHLGNYFLGLVLVGVFYKLAYSVLLSFGDFSMLILNLNTVDDILPVLQQLQCKLK